jgi:hypothetical protein
MKWEDISKQLPDGVHLAADFIIKTTWSGEMSGMRTGKPSSRCCTRGKGHTYIPFFSSLY